MKTAVEFLIDTWVKNGTLKGEDMFQATQMEKEQLEQFYNHGKWAIIEHGHGDEFIDYFDKTYKNTNE